ncbi:MAG: hypothetical protein CJBNEKGG_03880 [Prosthecobacter sp.]|nr:hypothetical protein [Prosthecobacter sp.]
MKPTTHSTDNLASSAQPEATCLVISQPAAVPARRWTRRQWLPTALLGFGGCLMVSRHWMTSEQERRRAAALASLREMVKRDLNEAGALAGQMVAPLRSGLETRLQSIINQGCATVSKAGNDLGNFWDCFHLIVRMGLDMVQGSKLADEYIAAKLGAQMQASTLVRSELAGALGSLHHQLSAQAGQLSSRWLEAADIVPAAGSADAIPGAMSTMAVQVRSEMSTFATSSVLGAAGAAAAGIHFYLKRELLEHVLGKFAHEAAKLAGANLGLAVADGPLPFGETVALLMDIGFSIWTAWDVYWLSRELPGKISHCLRDGLLQASAEAMAKFDREAAHLIEAAAEARQKAAAPVLALTSSTTIP